MPGYSDTPLAKKLGIKEGCKVLGARRIPGSAGTFTGVRRIHERGEFVDQFGACVCDRAQGARRFASNAAQETVA
jgi:hypothetical protein